ncbi:hypothetical protein niasHT_032307 [Heterodera trifolii]|uniref:B30.2/SPRY domain-containing protein n=1 Tax=Heterodera trifolii TaxID=157864 RepID=A0ABD2HYB1_9BILA
MSSSIGSPDTFFRSETDQEAAAAAGAEEVGNYEVFSWHGNLSDQLSAELFVTDQQLLKECREKLANSELRETKLLWNNGELNAENRALKAELEKQKRMTEHIELKAKVFNMEQEKQQFEKKYVSVDVFNSLVERIKQLENQQQKKEEGRNVSVGQLETFLAGEKQPKQQQKESVGQQQKKENVQQNMGGKCSVVDKNNVAGTSKGGGHSPTPAVVPVKMAKELPNWIQLNVWDATICHKDIEITGESQLTVNCKGNGFGWHSVFAKFPISKCCRPLMFYFEMKVTNLESFASIGFATKEMPLDGAIGQHLNSYGYRSDGSLGCNGISRPYKMAFGTMPMPFNAAIGQQRDLRYVGSANWAFPLEFVPVPMPSDGALAFQSPAFSTGDVVGCGVSLATRQIFLTKNGRRIDDYSFFATTPINSLFPCVSLWTGDKIEANFGPSFKFNLATL